MKVQTIFKLSSDAKFDLISQTKPEPDIAKAEVVNCEMTTLVKQKRINQAYILFEFFHRAKLRFNQRNQFIGRLNRLSRQSLHEEICVPGLRCMLVDLGIVRITVSLFNELMQGKVHKSGA